MIDVDYAGSPLVVDYGEARPAPTGRVPGSGTRTGRGSAERRTTCLFLAPSQTPSRSRGWADAGRSSSRSLTTRASIPLAPALPAGGVIMVRPDGHIGFRFPSTEAEAFAALDRHLGSYLIPVTPQDV